MTARPWRRIPSRVRLGLGLLAECVKQVALLPAFRGVLARPGSRPARPAGRHVVMLAISDVASDPRVERGARALAGAGFRVTILHPDQSLPGDEPRAPDWGPSIAFRRLPASTARFVLVFPWLFQHRLLQAAAAERPAFFHCHDLHTCLIGLAAAWRTGAACVCDFHEWFSENATWQLLRRRWRPHSRFKRAVLRGAERIVMRGADAVIAPCDSIAGELSRLGAGDRRRIDVVRNIPRPRTAGPAYPSLRDALGIPAERFLLLWQGGIGPTRMIEPIIESLALAPRAVLVIRGPGQARHGDAYRRLGEARGVTDRLILLDPVPSADVVDAARGADAGMWTLPNLCKNFHYALPNKVFEYLAAGLPILAAGYPEVRSLVERYEVGLCFDPYDPRSIAATINALIADPSRVATLRENARRASADLDPAREWGKLVAVYEGLGGCSSTPRRPG